MLSREIATLESIARAFPANTALVAAQAWLAARLAELEGAGS